MVEQEQATFAVLLTRLVGVNALMLLAVRFALGRWPCTAEKYASRSVCLLECLSVYIMHSMVVNSIILCMNTCFDTM